MDKHWTSYCQMSIVHFMAFPETMLGEGPIAETVAKIAEDDFFDAIEVGWIKDEAVRREVHHIAEVSHLTVAYGAHPALLSQKLNLNSLDPESRSRAVIQMKECVQEAAELGARRLVLLSGPDPGDALRGEATRLLVDSLHQICEHGRQYGVGITLETFDRSVEKRALIGPADEAAVLAAKIRSDYGDFGLLYDLSHMPLLDETALQALTILRDHLVHIHVGNCVMDEPAHPAYGDQHPRFGIAGGRNDVPQVVDFIRALIAIGCLQELRNGILPLVGFEVKPQAGESSTQVIANAKRVWRQAWARA